ncbi:uncharacterized protein LOC130722231 [Lotus japonicus]|uniref:uncharacterized protein LOC130722231 n=1 Tax=Lotus japonicus TaxID=34305 RepID=UPI00258DAD33|nr:uncharacterized protein LOC130722231 [Lotus japonicus]
MMKGFSSSCLANTHMFCSSIPLSFSNHNNLAISSAFPRSVANSNTRLFIRHSQPLFIRHSQSNHASCLVVQCASSRLVTELERDLKLEEGEGEATGIMRYRHNCREGKGAVELLECLEREAIMGADIGKEPMDYNRRAQIFERSSTVFQALSLRELDTASSDDVLSTP